MSADARDRFARSLARDLDAHRPTRIPRIRGFVYAAVAIAVAPRSDDDASVVLIGRALRRGDRWSGDVAFPGGLASNDDADGLVTARREAREEVGLELDEPVGTLSDRLTLAPGRRVPMRVRPFVFVLPELAELSADPREVAAIYTPTFREIDEAAKSEIQRSFGPMTYRFEARTLGDHRLWGLTYGLLDELRKRVARAGRRG